MRPKVNALAAWKAQIWLYHGRRLHPTLKPTFSPEPHLTNAPSSPLPPVTATTLAAFSQAWNRHDVDALMSFMTDDCVFETAAGPQAFGTRHSGQEAVRHAFAAAWASVPDVQWLNGVHFVQGDFGISQWTFVGTAADGSRIETDGVDIFAFRDGKIQSKKVFRKARPNLPAELPANPADKA
jgi:ketosteroid isomerase-like protein